MRPAAHRILVVPNIPLVSSSSYARPFLTPGRLGFFAQGEEQEPARDMFSPRSMTSLGSNPDAPAKRVEAETDILRGLFSTIFQELLSESEVQRSIQELRASFAIQEQDVYHKPYSKSE